MFHNVVKMTIRVIGYLFFFFGVFSSLAAMSDVINNEIVILRAEESTALAMTVFCPFAISAVAHYISKG